jgi:DNA sulfur modification protein DndD
LGGLFADEREAKQRRIDDVRRRIDALEDELRREVSAYLPLLAMRRTRDLLLEHVEVAIKLESVEALSTVFDESRARLREALLNVGVRRAKVEEGVDAVKKALVPRPIAISKETPSLSLREASWIQSILSKDVPRLRIRVAAVISEHRVLSNELTKLQRQVRQTPTNDPKTDAALKHLENAHEEMLAAGADFVSKQEELQKQIQAVVAIKSQLKKQRLIEFQGKRFSNRDRLIASLRTALPDYASRLRLAKESQFGTLLREALVRLWHKKNRIDEVVVDFTDRSIQLIHERKEVNRSSLSAAEKQLFATAFIYAVAKLSNRNLPFVIDTPVGRLDKRHRRNLVIDFLPTMSHQVVLFSTDTEIVGPLLRELRPLIAKEYDLADYNGGITMPVQLEVAL